MMDRASLFTEIVHCYLPKLYILIYQSCTLLFTNYGTLLFTDYKVAATLKKNIVFGKNSPLRKTGPKCISALIGMFSTASFDAAELVNMLMFA
jgi:hypothetical protein